MLVMPLSVSCYYLSKAPARMLDFPHAVQLHLHAQDLHRRASVMFNVTPFVTAAMTLMKPAHVRYYILLVIHSVHVHAFVLQMTSRAMLVIKVIWRTVDQGRITETEGSTEGLINAGACKNSLKVKLFACAFE